MVFTTSVLKSLNSHLVNYSQEFAGSPIFTEVGGAISYLNQSIKNVTLENSGFFLKEKEEHEYPTRGTIVRDLDNSLGYGNGVRSLVPNIPFLVDSKCSIRDGAEEAGAICPYHYAHIKISMNSGGDLPAIDFSRSDINSPAVSGEPVDPEPYYKTVVAMNNDDYFMTLNFKNHFANGGRFANTNRIKVELQFGTQGSTARLALQNLKGSARIITNGWARKNNMRDLLNHNGNAYYRQGNTWHLRFTARGNHQDYKATSTLEFGF